MRSTLRRRLRLWRRVGYGWGLAAGVVPAAASAAVTAWDPPREISGAGSAPLGLAATAGLGPAGNAVVLWHAAGGVQAVVRAPGRGFGKPRAIPGSNLSMPDLRPRLAFD